MRFPKTALLSLMVAACLLAQAQSFVKVTSKRVDRTAELGGELHPFLTVQLHAKVSSYVDKMLVDRGSFVNKGDLLVQLSAPEIMAHIAEAQTQLTSAQSDEEQAELQLAETESTYERLNEAARMPGAIAENELIQAKLQNQASKALVVSKRRILDAFNQSLKAQQDLATYLSVTAPFDGVITTRYVHPGALVGPGSDIPLLQLDQISHLRLTVAVPESDVSGIVKGAKVDFNVPAFPDRTFSGVIARPSYNLDTKTRTMAVELDVMNPQHQLAPGMYPSVRWPIERAKASLLVPKSSIVNSTEKVFVIRNNGGYAEWVDVRRGPATGNLVEVVGDLRPGDEIVEHATDEIRNGSRLAR